MPKIFAELDTPLCFTRFQALPGDAAKPGYYPGVLVIQKGPAKGHYAVQDGNRVVNYDPSNEGHAKLQKYQITIGDETLDDVVKCGQENESTKCKLDHGSTVRDIVGDYSSFRRDGDSVRADLTLDARLEANQHAIALVDKFANKIGNSIDFDYSYEINGDVAIARCRKLNSVDIVDAPAATKSLFNSNNLTTHMPLDAIDLKTIGDIFDAKLETKFTALETKFTKLEKKLEEGDEETDEEKKKRKEKEDADKDKGEMSEKKLSEIVEKASLAAVEKMFPKANREQFARITGDGETPMQALVKTYLAAGAPSQGIALQRIAKDHPTVYNAHMKSGGTL